jgi:hypothetical protein
MSLNLAIVPGWIAVAGVAAFMLVKALCIYLRLIV